MSPGLTETEAARRLAARGEPGEPTTSRSTATIVRANAITPFNAILLALGLLTLVFGDWRDALFLAIILTNTGIGIWQELHARTKARSSLPRSSRPGRRSYETGRPRSLHVSEIVVGDLVLLAPGDQVVADGRLLSGTDLRLDESILTGEAKAVDRGHGDEIRSGSFVVEGAGSFEVAAVGADSYAERIAGTAREFRHPRSPLERAIDRLLYVLLGVMVPLGAMLIVALWKQDVAVNHAVETAVAGMVTLIPEGLVLLVSITYAAAAVRMARAGALSQQLNAIESLASVDTLCIDKTGTLTEPGLRVVSLLPAAGVTEQELGTALGRFAASSEARNPTLEAVAAAWPADPEPADDVVPFLSRRRWSGLRIGGVRYVLGAPEVFALGELAGPARANQRDGRRVVAFGVATAAFPDDRGALAAVRPLGLAVLAEELRPATRETIAFLTEQGVEIVVLSGDSAEHRRVDRGRRRHPGARACPRRETICRTTISSSIAPSARSASSGGSRPRASVASSSRFGGAAGMSRWSETASTTSRRSRRRDSRSPRAPGRRWRRRFRTSFSSTATSPPFPGWSPRAVGSFATSSG